MSGAATLPGALALLRDDPGRTAILLDVDGTLAPIVRHAADATVPEATRGLLIQAARRFAVVACITGRRAGEARRIVSIGSLAYVGNHGGELLLPGAERPERDPAAADWERRVQDFARAVATPELERLRVRVEDKETIVAFHWRGAPDEPGAQAAAEALAARAQAEGLGVHWGRKVLEVRPPVRLHKGMGVHALLERADVDHALYAGDDATDLDAFRALTELAAAGRLRTAVRVGIRSDEGPPEIVTEADVVVDGPEGMRRLLGALVDTG